MSDLVGGAARSFVDGERMRDDEGDSNGDNDDDQAKASDVL